MARSNGGLVGITNVSAVVVLVLIGLAANVEAAVIRGDGCAVSIVYKRGDLRDPQPLVLSRGRNGTDFLYPKDNNHTLKLENGETVVLACPGKDNYVVGIAGLKNASEIEAVCLSGKTFGVDAKRFNFTCVACKYLPFHESRRTNKPCNDNDTHVEIGFALRNEFLPTIEICRNDRTMMTVWTKFRMTSKIGNLQSGFPRPGKWKSGDFYDKYNMEYQYKITTEVKTIEKLVGSAELARKYINGSTDLFMARGHMSAKADFVYGSAQSTTFWYLNAAPQWQTFNGGNWNSLEGNVRKYAATRTSDLVVYTGIHGHMSLADVNGNQVPIYLYVNGTTRAFPVPKFYWKIIHDPVAKKATAFVGSNDPWASEITEDMILCEDIADKIKWLTWKANNIVKGVSYACTIDDLRKSVPTIPHLKVDGILT